MLLLAIPLLLSLAADAKRIHVRSYPPNAYSAASNAQIRFANENKYDDTGPGAKEPEYAYKTYQNLEDALVAYLDDPDTQLPEHERFKAYNRLYSKTNTVGSRYTAPVTEKQEDDYATPELHRYLPKTVEEYFGLKPQQPSVTNKYSYPERNSVYDIVPKLSTLDFDATEGDDDITVREELERSKFLQGKKFQAVKTQPLSLTHYTREMQEIEPFNPNPKYSYSYGVHDKKTGDSKSAQETREGGLVRGYYSFLDADGKRRTVHYTADDEGGFRATVQRSQMNAP